jgi:hypothetical protein
VSGGNNNAKEMDHVATIEKIHSTREAGEQMSIPTTEADYETRLAMATARQKQLRRKVVKAMAELERCTGHVGWLQAKIDTERNGSD